MRQPMRTVFDPRTGWYFCVAAFAGLMVAGLIQNSFILLCLAALPALASSYFMGERP